MDALLAMGSRYFLTFLCGGIILICGISLLKIRTPKIEPALFYDSITGKEYPVTSWETSIGRSSSCDIVLAGDTVSRFHAVLAKQKKGWVITDTVSRSGTYVNDEKITEPTVIKNGDRLMFGAVTLVFEER